MPRGPSTQQVKERIRQTTCKEEVAFAAANIVDDREALKRVSREIFESVERLGAVKVKEYVISRTAKAMILVGRVLDWMRKIETSGKRLDSIH